MKRNRSDRILCSALPGAAAALMSAQVLAQTPAPAESMDEVIVTGSRIAAPNATSTSPINVVTRQDIQVSGKTDITDIISQLPQNFTNDLGQDLGNRIAGPHYRGRRSDGGSSRSRPQPHARAGERAPSGHRFAVHVHPVAGAGPRPDSRARWWSAWKS